MQPPASDECGDLMTNAKQVSIDATPRMMRPPVYASTPFTRPSAETSLYAPASFPQASTPYPQALTHYPLSATPFRVDSVHQSRSSTPLLPADKARRRLMPHDENQTAGIRTLRRTYDVNETTDTELRRVIDNFVQIYEQLDKCDLSDKKPNYSYTELAYLAMLRSPNFCLPIAQIYSYMQGRFRFFRNSSRKHWKNAVRHSLAKTMCFTKIPVGRGSSDKENLARSTYLWCIVPNSIAQFARGDYRATIDRESGTNTLRSAYFAMNSGQFWDSVGDYIADKMAIFRSTVQNASNPGSIFESQTCSVPTRASSCYWTNQSLPDLGMLENQNMGPPQKVYLRSGQPEQRQVFQNTQNLQNFNSEVYTTPGLVKKINPAKNTYKHVNSSTGISPATSGNFGAQAYNASSELRMPKTHAYIPVRQTPTPMLDPWLPTENIASPEQSLCSMDSERRTPPCSPFDFADSGFETPDLSRNTNSCQFFNADENVCRSRNFANLPSYESSANFASFDHFDLSPFSLSDFTDASGQNFNASSQQKITPDKRGYSPSLPQALEMGHPVCMSTPIVTENSKPTQCRFISEPVATSQLVCAAPVQFASVSAAPVFLVNGDHVFTVPVHSESGYFSH